VRTRDGVLHPLDVLVLATGFRVDSFVRPMRVAGDRGVVLDDVWADGPFAYMTLAVPGFPNFYMLNGPNGPVGNFSLIEVAELQMSYVLQMIERARSCAARALSPSREAAARFDAERRKAATTTIWNTGCKLVPRRVRASDRVAVHVRPLPCGDGPTTVRGLGRPRRRVATGERAGKLGPAGVPDRRCPPQ
jgi:hypothetical protein